MAAGSVHQRAAESQRQRRGKPTQKEAKAARQREKRRREVAAAATGAAAEAPPAAAAEGEAAGSTALAPPPRAGPPHEPVSSWLPEILEASHRMPMPPPRQPAGLPIMDAIETLTARVLRAGNDAETQTDRQF